MWGIPEREKRRCGVEMLYELETAIGEDGWPSDFVHDAERDLYRFPDGQFAFSRRYANKHRLRQEGMIG